jgi:hypothetical protein
MDRIAQSTYAIRELRSDCQSMNAMFFADPPTFDDIVRDLTQLESEIIVYP